MSYQWTEASADFLDLKDIEEQLSQLVDKSELGEMLRIQLSELEMLQSMFSNPGELEVYDLSVVADMNEFVHGKCTILPPRLDFTVKVQVDRLKLELCVNLPHDYPTSEPDIFARSDQLSRNQQHLLNSELANFLSSLEKGDICIGSVISWLQENAAVFYTRVEIVEPQMTRSLEGDKLFVRYWIYSHHIYSKIKRRDILDLANEFNVSGFCLPGRPGIICVEGWPVDCDEWWHKVRCMNWKKIMCKKKEEISITVTNNINSLRKFSGFQEISFLDAGKSKSRDCHMDMAEFYRYLSEKNCGYAFKDYFGVEGKPGATLH